MTFQIRRPEPPVPWTRSDWLRLISVLAVAAAARLILFTGFFGSDETNYSNQALAIAAGRWTATSNWGDLRLGQSVPMAFFTLLLGPSISSLNLWSLLCSLGEIALVYYAGWMMWGAGAALLASVFLAFLPLHLHFAGRLMADPPLAFFITLSMVLFLAAERRGSRRSYLAAGLAAGFVFWIKEVVIIFAGVFGLYAIVFRKLSVRWIWVAVGFFTAIGLSCALFWLAAGDPLHVFKVIAGTVDRGYVQSQAGWVATSPHYYFSLMLTDMRDLWLVPYFALASLFLVCKELIQRRGIDQGAAYALTWAAGLIAIFSFTVISLHPLIYIGKQSNYMQIFAAPLCLLAAYAANALHRKTLLAAMAVYIAGGIILAAFERQSIHTFTAGSKATLTFAREHPNSRVYGMENAARIAKTVAQIEGGFGAPALIHPISELYRVPPTASHDSIYAVVDPRTADMGRNPIRTLADVPGCWKPMGQLASSDGSYAWLRTAIGHVDVDRLPKSVASLARVLRVPEPTYVFRVDAECAAALETR